MCILILRITGSVLLTYPDFGLHVQVRQERAKKIADERGLVVSS